MANDIQAKANELENEKFELTKKIQEYEAWTKLENLYELKELSAGRLVYGYKKNELNCEPFHLLCPSCFSKKRKSILQNFGITDKGIRYGCHDCKFEIYDPTQKKPIPTFMHDNSGTDGWMSR